MTAPILATGSTGTLGSLVVLRQRAAGRDVRVLSRSGREGEAGIAYVPGDLATGTRCPIVPLPLPSQAARAFRDGDNLTPDRAVGHRTWEEFLAARLGASGRRRLDPAS